MIFVRNVLRVAACAVLFSALATSAHATYIIRSWVVTGTETPWLGATEAVFPNPTTGLDATATSNTVNFSLPAGVGTLRNFLLSDPFTTLMTCTTATVGAVTYNCNTDVMSTGTATNQTPTTYGQILEITGMETFVAGTTYSITHDDGITVHLDGATIINAPGSSFATTNTFTASGTHSIDIIYGECCGLPAQLTSNLPTNVPEPSNLTSVLGLLLIGVGLLFRRRKDETA